MTALLEGHGFGAVEHVRQRDSIPAALWDRTDSLRPAGLSVLARATVRPGPADPAGTYHGSGALSRVILPVRCSRSVIREWCDQWDERDRPGGGDRLAGAAGDRGWGTGALGGGGRGAGLTAGRSPGRRGAGYSRGMPDPQQARRERLRPALTALGADAALITSLANVRYLTGLASSNAALLLPAAPPGAGRRGCRPARRPRRRSGPRHGFPLRRHRPPGLPRPRDPYRARDRAGAGPRCGRAGRAKARLRGP